MYTPAGGLPGDNSAGANYNFISDIPEPSVSALALLGGGLLVFLQRRKARKLLAVVAFTSAIALTTAIGQPGPLITVDELGNGNFNGATLPRFQSPDPSSC